MGYVANFWDSTLVRQVAVFHGNFSIYADHGDAVGDGADIDQADCSWRAFDEGQDLFVAVHKPE